MSKKYVLRYHADQGEKGRWRKIYKGRYFQRQIQSGETKSESHERVLREFLEWKRKIDEEDRANDPHRKAWLALMENVGTIMDQLTLRDTLGNREWWAFWNAQRETYRVQMERGDPCPMAPEQAANPNALILGGGDDDPDDHGGPTEPPWEVAARKLDNQAEPNGGKLTLRKLADKYLARRMKADKSAGDYEKHVATLNALCGILGNDLQVDQIDPIALVRVRDDFAGRWAPTTAHHRMVIVKKFVRWLFEMGWINALPRNLDAADLKIAMPTTSPETFTDQELVTVFEASPESVQLYMLLMLNTGAQQQDIADLRPDEVDWTTGYVTRKRGKTKGHDNSPKVTWKLWPRTLQLLNAQRSTDSDRVLLNANDKPLKIDTIVGGKRKTIDNIKSSWGRVLVKLKNRKVEPIQIDKPMKLLRKTAATRLGEHPAYGRFAQHYLAHAPTTVADAHYVVPSQTQFDEAMDWLGKQWPFTQ